MGRGSRTREVPPAPRIWGYIRVSTDTQTVENQRYEIREYLRREGLAVDGWIEETISGTKDPSKRELGRLLDKARKGDTIVSSEISRLGRSLLMVMGILNHCMTRGIHIRTIKDGFRLEANLQSQILAFAFGLSAQIERDMISRRTKEALALRRANGQRLGRPPGRRTSTLNPKCTAAHGEITRLLDAGMSVPRIAKAVGVSPRTMYRYLAYSGLREPSRRGAAWARGIYK